MNDRFNRFKFRTWNKKTKTMKKVMALISEEGVYYSLMVNENEAVVSPCEEPHMVLMQCTGLKDTNRRLIYEGDIVNCYVSTKKLHRYQVKYEIGCFALVSPDEEILDFKNKWNDNIYPLSQLYFEYQDEETCIWRCEVNCEVIGNIYENPELLATK